MGTPLQGHTTSDTLLRRLSILSTLKFLKSGEAYTSHGIGNTRLPRSISQNQRSALTFLGIVINTHTFELQLPLDKQHRTQQVREWSHKGSCTRHQLELLLGICLTRHLRAERSFTAILSRTLQPHHRTRADLAWWNFSPGLERQVVLFRSDPGSHVGCIGFLRQHVVSSILATIMGSYQHHSKRPIVIAAFWGSQWTKSRVHFFCDNIRKLSLRRTHS